jgi:D-ribose pyranose/furanose isomerase RbsD
MLKSRLLHPEILEALGRAGHSSKILIADASSVLPVPDVTFIPAVTQLQEFLRHVLGCRIWASGRL